jgi:hypothetical protein
MRGTAEDSWGIAAVWYCTPQLGHGKPDPHDCAPLGRHRQDTLNLQRRRVGLRALRTSLANAVMQQTSGSKSKIWHLEISRNNRGSPSQRISSKTLFALGARLGWH